MGVRQERVPDYLAEAQKLGDWDSRRGINRKDGAKEDREVFAGSDWWRNYDERQAQQPAVKQGGSQQRSLIHDRKASSIPFRRMTLFVMKQNHLRHACGICRPFHRSRRSHGRGALQIVTIKSGPRSLFSVWRGGLITLDKRVLITKEHHKHEQNSSQTDIA